MYKRRMRMKKIIITVLIGIIIFFLLGCVNFLITTDLENPFVITILWNDVELVPDPDTGELPLQMLDADGAVVTALVFDENGVPVVPEIYEWYLRGELIKQNSDTITLDNSPGIGSYWLDIIVGKDTILSSEQVEFIIIE